MKQGATPLPSLLPPLETSAFIKFSLAFKWCLRRVLRAPLIDRPVAVNELTRQKPWAPRVNKVQDKVDRLLQSIKFALACVAGVHGEGVGGATGGLGGGKGREVDDAVFIAGVPLSFSPDPLFFSCVLGLPIPSPFTPATQAKLHLTCANRQYVEGLNESPDLRVGWNLTELL